MKKLILMAAAVSMAFGATAIAAPPHHKTKQQAHAATGPKTRLGTLSCAVDGGVGMLIGSSKAVQCKFMRTNGSVEKYAGRIGKLGIDIGITKKSYLQWIVYTAAGNRTGDGALAGSYAGVTAGASVGIGLGANALIGGTSKNFGLQPFSAEATQGLNVAAGATQLTLRAAR
ncbi:DUF992 domain-containing protein [Phyllobacterium myrsinacearum]|uniref:DUF992 domain-containing protein n=1 Tax=Phyllobacterium myrsinacearum TaxID=28101 RepID=A0A839EFF5_9HYPH|nr:DUF992 domain-containing protein [Phyllobacterium myrsinacearum]MBA8877652.1 hypothetical protein [Phyllobacterium myrsinacearum]